MVGRHLILDVTTKNEMNLDRVDKIYNLLESLSTLLNMTLVYPPIVGQFPFANNELKQFIKKLEEENTSSEVVSNLKEQLRQKDERMSGVSGITVWLESHAAIHTWPERKFFSFDAYSCCDFDSSKVIPFLQSYFDFDEFYGIDIIRRVGSPPEIPTVHTPCDSL